MGKELHLYTKKELISIIQDYQEMTSEIEESINAFCRRIHKKDAKSLPNLEFIRIRDIITKYIC
jgi:hypothetical protein